MRYFAKLTLGGHYRTLAKGFDRGVETLVTQDEYDYLSKVTERRLVSQGNGFTVVHVPRFETRIEEPTKVERILEEVKDVPDKLAPKKPGTK